MSLSLRRTVIESLISALVAAVLSLIVFGPLLRSVSVAWAGGDMLSTYVNAEVWRGFAYGQTTHFGYPLGMNLNMFPNIDITENLFAQVVTGITGQPFIGINLLIMLSFPLVAALAYLVIRMTGLRGPLAIAFAVTFAMIPFHWGRALGHTYLSTLYSLVTGMALVLLIGSGTFDALVGGGSRRTRRWTIIAVVLLCVVTAWTGLYFAAFTLLLGAVSLLWRWANGATWRRLGRDAIPFAGVALLVVVGFLPGLLAVRAAPPLAPLSERLPIESVTFAGNLAIALLPLPQSSLPGMEAYNARIVEAIAAAPWGESNAITNHGTWITTAALVIMVGGLVAHARRRAQGRPVIQGRVTLGFISALTVTTLLFFVPWGLNYLFAGTVTAQIRGWNRLVPVLLLLFLLGASRVLAHRRVAERWIVALPIGLVLLGLVAIDSVYPFRAAYAQSVEEAGGLTDAARSYREDVNRALPGHCGILQLPYMAYPEFGRLGDINDYDHFWTSLTNPEKSWSYGAVKNTSASVWMSQLNAIPDADETARLRGAGFCGIHLDLRATISEKRAELINAFAAQFGKPIASGLDGRWLLFSMGDGPTADAATVTSFLQQPAMTLDPATISPRMTTGVEDYWWTTADRARLTLTPIAAGHPVTRVQGLVQAPPCGARPVTVTLGEGLNMATTTIVAKPDVPAAFEVALPQASYTPVPLVIEAPGGACAVGSYSTFARLSQLQSFTNEQGE